MEVIICPDDEQVGQVAADRVVAQLAGKEEPVLGLATGSSPTSLYQELARRVAAGEIDLARAYGFALDEYVGIAPDHPLSYRRTVLEMAVEPLGMDPARVHVPNGFTTDIEGAAREFEDEIAKVGGVDVQILGIGSNGHIGFNEPTSSLSSRTRLKTLTWQTRQDNSRFFLSHDQDIPTHCVTQGLGTIMEATACLLVATGENKAGAIHDMVEGPVSAFCPASILQFHPKAFVVVDEAAASKLEFDAYYRFVADNPLSL